MQIVVLFGCKYCCHCDQRCIFALQNLFFFSFLLFFFKIIINKGFIEYKICTLWNTCLQVCIWFIRFFILKQVMAINSVVTVAEDISLHCRTFFLSFPLFFFKIIINKGFIEYKMCTLWNPCLQVFFWLIRFFNLKQVLAVNSVVSVA